MVRITGGVFRGRRLEVPPGIRPSTELARKAAFDILGDAVQGARVLDAAAGSGAYGLEALSRGASHVTFVESDQRVLDVLGKNIFLASGERPGIPQSTGDFLRKGRGEVRSAVPGNLASGGSKSAKDSLRRGRGERRSGAPAAPGTAGSRETGGEPRLSVVSASISAFVSNHLLSRSLFGVIFHDPPYEAASEADLSGLLSLLPPGG